MVTKQSCCCDCTCNNCSQGKVFYLVWHFWLLTLVQSAVALYIGWHRWPSAQAGKPSGYLVSHLGTLGLAIRLRAGAMSTSRSCRVNRHTTRCTSPLSMVLPYKLVSGEGYENEDYGSIDRCVHAVRKILYFLQSSWAYGKVSGCDSIICYIKSIINCVILVILETEPAPPPSKASSGKISG